VGEITHLSGRLLDAKGAPIRNGTVEIWQVDHNAVYLAERGGRESNFDANFQGFGRFLTGLNGDYYFRTIKPVPYRSRPAPHIHFKVTIKGRRPWTTQLFVKGHPGNLRDGVYTRSGDAKTMASVTTEFTPMKSSRVGELAAHFDIVMGFTPEG
jgi:protocatechuate 3,4-dioxygenase beta subunit